MAIAGTVAVALPPCCRYCRYCRYCSDICENIINRCKIGRYTTLYIIIKLFSGVLLYFAASFNSNQPIRARFLAENIIIRLVFTGLLYFDRQASLVAMPFRTTSKMYRIIPEILTVPKERLPDFFLWGRIWIVSGVGAFGVRGVSARRKGIGCAGL